MTPGTAVRIVAGPYWPACHDARTVVAHHAPGPTIPVTVLLPTGGVVTADVLPHEIEAA